MLCFSDEAQKLRDLENHMALDIVVFIAVVAVASIFAHRGKLLSAVGIVLLGAAVLTLGPMILT